MMKGNRKYWHNVFAVAWVILGLFIVLAIVPIVQGGGNPNPAVLPLNSHSHGNTYGEWSARWWQWLLSIPEAANPNLDTTGANCAEGQVGQVWFLAGSFDSTPVTRDCTIPTGRALFFPILNTVFGAGVGDCEPSNPGVPCDVNALRALAAAPLDNPITLEASIDGVELKDLINYRVQSPVFSLTFPAGAVFGLPSGTFTPQVSDGYWLMLAPLSAGTHTIHFKGVRTDGFELEVTYNLTIK